MTTIKFDENFKENVKEEQKRLDYIETKSMYDLNRPVTEILTSNTLWNKKCFVIAGGPSLAGKFDFSSLKNQFTIGMNKTCIDYPTNILFCWDYDFYQEMTTGYLDKKYGKPYLKSFLEFKGLKVFLAIPARIKYEYGCYVVNRQYRERVYYDIAEGIYSGNNSAFASIMLAVSMGCKEIYLLGADCKIDEQNKKTHYHEGYEWTLGDFRERCKIFKDHFDIWAPRWKTQNINITQLFMESENETSLRCFPLKKYSKLLEEISI